MSTIDKVLTEKKIELPQPAKPVGNYVGYVRTGNLVHVSGQVPAWNGELRFKGKLGKDFTEKEGYEAARVCALNILSQLREACGGDLDRVVRVVKLGGFVNGTPDFNDAPKCVNGASDLMAEVFGPEKGPHARFAVCVASLPAGVAVEVDGLFEIKS
ncbi:MAG: RidA family protein [Rhodospirillales bacterium]|jgi:enamine deaminase RidA (YjgF/YER057c/UK114 family)|nr:RidA family protein [Rhodospirillales bacterium]